MRGSRTLTMVPFGEWTPDLPAIGNQGLVMARNVIALTEGSYTGMPSLAPFQDALPSQVSGQYSLTDVSGAAYEWAGDTNKLYVKATASASWIDATKTGATYNPAGGAGHWTVTAFGKRIIAANGADPVQTYLQGTDSRFSDLAASAPRGRYVAVIRDFVFLANMAASGLPQRVQWSAVGNPLSWPTPGTDAAVQVQSDSSDLEQTDLGAIQGVFGAGFGGSDGAIFASWGVYRISYVGSPVIFEFTPSAGAPGTLSPKAVAVAPISTQRGSGFFALYLSTDGFYAYDGSSASAIGAQKFDRMFYLSVDESAIADVQAVADPQRKLAMWAYRTSGFTGRYNRLLAYNWELARATVVDLTETPVEWVTDRDSGDRIFRLVAFRDNHQMHSFTGPSMASEIVTGDRQLFAGRKALVTGTRPIVDGDANSATITLAARDVPTDEVVWDAEIPVDILGNCPTRSAGRYVRFRLRRPAGTVYRHMQGIEVTAAAAGRRR